MRLIAVDPGSTTGWALFEVPAQKPFKVGEVKEDDFLEWLYNMRKEVDIWVVEDYIIRPESRGKGHQHFWDKGRTLRLIGAIQFSAFTENAHFILQQPSIKPLAYKHMGAEYVKGKRGMHIQDAIAHGVHYLRKYSVREI